MVFDNSSTDTPVEVEYYEMEEFSKLYLENSHQSNHSVEPTNVSSQIPLIMSIACHCSPNIPNCLYIIQENLQKRRFLASIPISEAKLFVGSPRKWIL